MASSVYLDHAGSGRFLPDQIEESMRQLMQSIYSNPHSGSQSSKLTTELIDQARYRILEFFHTTNDEYSVIFTSGCTAALKMVSESIDWSDRCDHCQYNVADISKSTRFDSKIDWSLAGSKFVYLMDNHTSAVGMRSYPIRANATVHCIRPEEVDEFLDSQKSTLCKCIRLFVYPGQSNFCGRKYVKQDWIKRFHELGSNWFVCMDAAALASTNDCDLSLYKPDFFAISFYKIFGYPTGLGALLIRNQTVGTCKNGLMKKSYFGGGTVKVALNSRDFVSFRDDSLSQRFEDGTVAFQQILALQHGFDALKKRGGIGSISSHAFSLASYAYKALTSIKHSNGSPIAAVYCHDGFTNPNTQGPILNFNLLRSDGSYVGYSEAEKMAELYDVHWRTGCFCNQGACQMYLQLSDEKLMKNFESGKICGDTIDLIDGQPVGSIRISFGWTSTLADVQQFIRMIWECFVDRGSLRLTLEEALEKFQLKSPDALNGFKKPIQHVQKGHAKLMNGISAVEDDEFHDALDIDRCPINDSNVSGMTLTDIYIYPVKSCAAIRALEWMISERGLHYDRRWMIVTNEGLCLNQKRESRMCMIRPNLDDHRLLLACDQVERSLSVPLDNEIDTLNGANSDTAIAGPYCQSKVCADRVSTADCGDVVGEWIDEALNRSGCRLVAQTDDIPRVGKGGQNASVSLANEEQYLLLHRPSIRRLLSLIHTTSPDITEDDLVLRFRPNLVVDGGQPFEEDAWKSVQIGGIEFQCVGKCTRCQMICVDQNTGEMDKNVLLALRELRDNKTTFGIYLQTSALNVGKKIRVGQEVTVEKD